MPEPLRVVSEDDRPVQKVIATGLSIIVGLTNDRQMTFSSGYEGDEDDSSINARLDRMMRFADRLKARYEIGEIEKRLADNRKGLAQFKDHIRTAEDNRDRDLADFDVQIAELERLKPEERAKHAAEMDAKILRFQEMRKEHFNLALETHQTRGRSGSFVPRGQDKVNLDRIDLAIKQAGEAKDKDIEAWDVAYDRQIDAACAEREKRVETARQEVQSLTHTVDRHAELIAEDEAELAKRRAVAEG